MDCSCVDMDVNCYADILKDTMPVARKEHECGECKRIIHPGEIYRSEKTVYDGMLTTQKTCIDCNSIRESFICGSWYWGEILEAVQNNIYDCSGKFSESAVKSLTIPARTKICEMIQRYWDWADE